jgi:predicted  nucleic acid-binding Zn-ribbon protein
MNPNLQHMMELERVTLEIARLSDEVASLPKKVAAIEAKLAQARSQVEAAQKEIKDAEAQKRKQESEIQDWQQKIVKYREQSSAVKTNEQYKALMEEIRYAEQHIAGIEEAILVGMEAADGMQARLQQAQAALKEDMAAVEAEKEHARTLTAEDEKRLEALRTEQAGLRARLDAALVAHFDRVVAKRKNAMAEAFEQKCLACNVMMRPQRYNELISGTELITCDSCGRILYLDPGHRSSVPAKKLSGPERVWYHVSDGGESGRFLHFTNQKGGCTLRSYDAGTGRLLAVESHRKTTFQDVYKDLVAAGQLLHHSYVPHDEEESLPPDELEEMQLRAQIAPGAMH